LLGLSGAIDRIRLVPSGRQDGPEVPSSLHETVIGGSLLDAPGGSMQQAAVPAEPTSPMYGGTIPVTVSAPVRSPAPSMAPRRRVRYV